MTNHQDNPSIHDPFINEETGRINKSATKRHMEALRETAEQLLNLPLPRFAEIPMPESLLREFEIVRALPLREARRRQIRHIAKLLDEIDRQPIEEALNEAALKSRSFRQHQQVAEQWLETLVNGESPESFLQQYPAADRQRLRQLLRSTIKETTPAKQEQHKAKLFHLLREAIEASN